MNAVALKFPMNSSGMIFDYDAVEYLGNILLLCHQQTTPRERVSILYLQLDHIIAFAMQGTPWTRTPVKCTSGREP